MIIRGKEGLELSKLKVKYSRDGEEFEQSVGEEGKQWWLDFEQKWEHTEVIEFTDIAYTDKELTRFEEVKGLDVSEDIILEYIESGTMGEGLEALKHKKENEELKQLLADLTEIILMGGA